MYTCVCVYMYVSCTGTCGTGRHSRHTWHTLQDGPGLQPGNVDTATPLLLPNTHTHTHRGGEKEREREARSKRELSLIRAHGVLHV